MSGSRSDLVDLARTDTRYALEAYEFLCHALAYTQKSEGKGRRPAKAPEAEGEIVGHHVTGQQLLEGVRRFASDQFGMMAPVVFKLWGVHTTADFGAMVYKLIDAGLWHKSPTDNIGDFTGLYDFEDAFVRDFKIEWDEI